MKIISQSCSRKNEHNKPIGVVNNDVDNVLEKEIDLIALLPDDSRCVHCTYNSSYALHDSHSFLTYYKIEEPTDKFTKLIRLLAYFVGINVLLITLFLGLIDYKKLLEESYWGYLTPVSILMIALASLADIRTTKFGKAANLFAAAVAIIMFVITYLL